MTIIFLVPLNCFKVYFRDQFGGTQFDSIDETDREMNGLDNNLFGDKLDKPRFGDALGRSHNFGDKDISNLSSLSLTEIHSIEISLAEASLIESRLTNHLGRLAVDRLRWIKIDCCTSKHRLPQAFHTNTTHAAAGLYGGKLDLEIVCIQKSLL